MRVYGCGAFLWITVAIAARSPNVSASPAGGRITRLVAGAERLFALRGRSLIAVDGRGRLLGRCAPFEPPPERAERSRTGALDADEALAAAGLPDDEDGTPEAEEALEEEGLAPRRRPRRDVQATVEATVEFRDIAAAPSSNEVWIASSAGLLLGRDGGCARAGLAGRDLAAVAANAEVVAAASDQLLWRGDARTSSFAVAAGLALPPRALAVTEAAHVLVGDDDGVVDVGPDGATARVLDRATDALAVCDGVVVALAADGVYSWNGDDRPARVAERPPARALACGRTADRRFIAAGVGVWTSADGASWIERTGALGRSVTAAAAIPDRVWLAIDGELVVLGEDSPAQTASGAATPAGQAPLPTGRLLATVVPWPRLSIVLAAHQAAIRAGWSVAVLLTFPLGRGVERGKGASALAAELVHRDADLAAEEADPAAHPGDEESDAWQRALAQERAALR